MQSLLSPPATNIQPLPEYKSTVAKKPRWVLSHYGMFKTCWDMLVLLATIYVAIVVPYNAAFQVRHFVGEEINGNDIIGEVPPQRQRTHVGRWLDASAEEEGGCDGGSTGQETDALLLRGAKFSH